jgi:FkbM family methyltransferase
VIDVGANVGQFAVAISRMMPVTGIYAIEPLPNAAALLRKHLKKVPSTKVFEAAVGNAMRTGTMYVNVHSQSSSLLARGRLHQEAFPGEVEESEVSVNVVRLDDLFRNVALPRPLLIKVDTQGYERAVVQGGVETFARADFALLEVSFAPLYAGESTFGEIQCLMHSIGFEFVRPVGWLESPSSGEILQMDALFSARSEPRH